MALFSKSDPTSTAQAAVDVAVKARVGLHIQYSDAVAQLDAATVTVNELANAGADDMDLGKAESKVSEADKLVKRRLLAVETKDAEIKTLQAVLDDAADQKQRNETVIDCHRLESELVKEGELIAASAARFSGIAARIIPIAPEANGLKDFSDVLVAQIPEAVTLLSRLIREHAAAVLRREAPSTVKKPETPYVVPVPTKPVRMPLFCTRSVKFIDPDSGKLIAAQKFSDIEMPPSYAKAALENKICVRITDPLRAQHKGTVGGHPDASLAYDLDAAMNEPKPAAVDPIRASSPTASPFTVVDRGGPVQMKVAR
jgi:hypothetical protein